MEDTRTDTAPKGDFPSHEEMKESTIFLLGAGFSRGYNEDRVPLVSDFLGVAHKFGFLKPSDEHRDFIDFVNKYFGDYRYVNIETLATFLTLQLPPLWSFKQEPRDKHYQTLKELIVSTLSNIYSHPASPEIKSVYSSFVSTLLTMRTTVLTFNYDTLLENLLRETKKWSILSGYGVSMRTPMYEFTRGLAAKEREYLGRHRRKEDGGVAYLKLHGSLNWGKLLINPPYENENIYVDSFGLTMFDHERPKNIKMDPIGVFVGGVIGPNESSGFAVRGEPFIVPPILSKEALLREPLLLGLWYHAMNHFSTAENVIVIGYSFPPTDFLAAMSICHGVSNRFSKKPMKVWCIDRWIDDGYKERAKVVFRGCEINFLQMDTVKFLSLWTQK